MCYDIKASLEAQLKRARRKGDREAERQIREQLVPLTNLPIHHSSGFDHPSLLIYTDRSPDFPEVATWGLVPFWVKDREGLQKLWNKTLNARGETLFEKPSFRDSARNRRCLIYIDGFYEHHHYKGKAYPYYIYRKDQFPIVLAGLWSEWRDPEQGHWLTTFSVVTTTANRLLSEIHNNPRIKGPRMPLILPDELEDKWLEPLDDERDIQGLKELICSYPDNELGAHTVRRLRGKSYPGNVPEISSAFHYPELPDTGTI